MGGIALSAEAAAVLISEYVVFDRGRWWSTVLLPNPRRGGQRHPRGVLALSSHIQCGEAGAMEVELDQLDLRYEGLRVRSAERDRRILASLSEIGQMVPIVIVSADEPADGLVVIDGYRRVRGLRQLHRDVVQAVHWDLSEIDALLLRRSLSMGSGETSLEQAWLCQELRQRFDLSLEELALRFDRSPSWVSRRLALVGELPARVQELIRKGKIVPHAAAKHLVPLARANRDDCERLAENIASHHLSSREVGEIYAAWRDAAPTVREHIVDDPQLFLRTRRAVAEESRRHLALGWRCSKTSPRSPRYPVGPAAGCEMVRWLRSRRRSGTR